MLKIQKFTFNPFQENTFLLWDAISLEAMIIDPGCSNNNEEEILNSFINEQKLSVQYLLNTHCHIDHILGNAFVKEKYNCKYFAPELDLPLLDNLISQAEMFGVKAKKSPLPDEFITEDLILKLGEIELTFLFTPGHTPGEYCIYSKSENVCFSGDVLFYESIGRTDLWGGDYDTLINSINNKLFILPEITRVFPGHGEETTIGHEKKNNPFLT